MNFKRGFFMDIFYYFEDKKITSEKAKFLYF